MPETNFDSKLRKTISMMHEINQLMGDAEIQSQMHKDESSMKDSILFLKQNILNQHESQFLESQTLLDNPPMVIVDIKGTKVEQIDQQAFQELKQNFIIAQANLDFSKTNYDQAKTDAVFIRNQLAEKDQVKNILESELDQLYNQVSSLLDTVKQGVKLDPTNKEKDKELVKENNSDSNNSKDQNFFNSSPLKNPYFKHNSYLNDFYKAIDSSPSRTSFMPIQAIDDN
jgi:hypothetical protein